MKDLHRTFIIKEVQERVSSVAISDTGTRSSQSSATGSADEVALDLQPLKNILLAYSLRNPAVGYCQSMNFVCAMLLLHLEEEQAFWALAALVETLLLADYYAPSMIGTRVDQLTFQSCLAWKLPKLFAHIRSLDVILEPILCPWFLCLFLHVLPLDAVQRIWDCFFFEGNVILFRVGLALCKLLEPELLAADDVCSLFVLLKKPLEGRPSEQLVEPLLAAAFDKSWMGSIPRAALDHFRGEHLATLQEIDREAAGRDKTVFGEMGSGRSDKSDASATIFKGVERSLACVLQSVGLRESTCSLCGFVSDIGSCHSIFCHLSRASLSAGRLTPGRETTWMRTVLTS